VLSFERWHALVQLYADYAAALDEGRWDAWPEFFTDDAIYKLQPRENFDRGLPLATMSFESKGMLKDRVVGATDTLFHDPYYQRHVVGAPRVLAVNGAAIDSEASYVVIRTKQNALPEVYSAGRYLDRVVDTPAGLRFAQRLVIFDTELISNSIIYPI